ncbi:MAG: hypothetical protein U5O39_09390 [Gammaproteobacteria bacterium]|nr:hypothetical protein [Gammaproteobacteria bacterium]
MFGFGSPNRIEYLKNNPSSTFTARLLNENGVDKIPSESTTRSKMIDPTLAGKTKIEPFAVAPVLGIVAVMLSVSSHPSA